MEEIETLVEKIEDLEENVEIHNDEIEELQELHAGIIHKMPLL